MKLSIRDLFVCLVAGGVSTAAMAQQSAAGTTNQWDTKVAVGISVTDGNSKTLSANGSVITEKKAGKNEMRFGAEGSYSEEEGTNGVTTTTVNGAKFFGGYKRLLDGRWYANAEGSLGFDEIADVDYRLIVSPGMGYYLIKEDDQTLSVEAGPAYIHEKIAGESDDKFALRAAERYELKLSPTSKFWQSAEYLPDTADFASYLLNTEVGTEAALNATLSLRLVLKDAYNSTPAEGRENNDLSLLGMLVVKL